MKPAAKLYRAVPLAHYPKHGRLRTYWQAKKGTWSCGHVHHSEEVAAECATALNDGVSMATAGRRAGARVT